MSAVDSRANSPVEVAVGVVIREDGRILLGQRPPGKPYAGWWEFPGGKLEAGETVSQALARELHEELGFTPRASHPWVIREFVYPHAHVRLHFHRVFEFDGEPRSREGQSFDWQAPERITAAPLLPATVPVIGWLRLPGMCALSAAAGLGMDAFVDAVTRRLRPREPQGLATQASAPLRLLLLDEPEMAPDAFEHLFHRLAPLCRAHGVMLLVGSRHGLSYGPAADGVLLRGDALALASGRPRGRLAAAWCDDAQAVAHAQAIGLDFVVVPRPLAQPAGLPAYVLADLEADFRGGATPGAHGLAVAARYWVEPREELPGRVAR